MCCSIRPLEGAINSAIITGSCALKSYFVSLLVAMTTIVKYMLRVNNNDQKFDVEEEIKLLYIYIFFFLNLQIHKH